MTIPARQVVTGLACVCLLLAGCGDSAAPDETAAVRSITKATFVERGDAICAATEKKVAAESARLFDESGGGSAADIQEILVRTAPDYQAMIDDMQELRVPAGDEEQVAAMFHAMQRRIDWIREDPEGFIAEKRAVNAQYEEMLALVKGYGFKRCYQ